MIDSDSEFRHLLELRLTKMYLCGQPAKINPLHFSHAPSTECLGLLVTGV